MLLACLKALGVISSLLTTGLELAKQWKATRTRSSARMSRAEQQVLHGLKSKSTGEGDDDTG